MNRRALGLAMVALSVALTLASVVARHRAPAGDFTCTVDGVATLTIERVDSARMDGGAWRVDVEGGFYLYASRAGELCAVMP